MKKKIGVLAFIVAIFALAAGIVGAQDRPGGNRPGGNNGGNRPGGRDGMLAEVGTIVQEQTGLTAQELRQGLAQGKTLEQLITESGGDVEAVITAIVQASTERINQAVTEGKLTRERADEMLANLAENVRNLVTTGARPEGQRSGPVRSAIELSQILLEEAGLEAEQVRAAVASGQTIADLIAAAGGNVEAIVDATITEATTRINEAVAAGNLEQARADEMLNNLETAVTNMVNGEGIFNRDGGMGRAFPLVNEVATATGLTSAEVAEQVRNGSTLANILTANGVTVETFVDEQLVQVKTRLDAGVQNGTISQAVADARLNLRRVELTDALNRTPKAQPAAPAGGNA
jgi:hypothetical protein